MEKAISAGIFVLCISVISAYAEEDVPHIIRYRGFDRCKRR